MRQEIIFFEASEKKIISQHHLRYGRGTMPRCRRAEYVLFCLKESFLFRIRLLVICMDENGEPASPTPAPRGVVAVAVDT